MSKIVVVTGAGTGVGRRVAEVLSKEGMVVYLIGRRKDKLIETQNLCSGQTEILQCDVSDPHAVKYAFEIVEKIRRNNSLNDATNPSDAIDDALESFHSLEEKKEI